MNQQLLSVSEAAKIMGSNFFGVEHSRELLKSNPAGAEQDFFQHVPFSLETLEACCETHILFAYTSMLVTYLTQVAEITLYQHCTKDRETIELPRYMSPHGWHLVCKKPFQGWNQQTWYKQEVAVTQSRDTRVPETSVFAQVVVGHFLQTGQRIFYKEFARTGPSGASVGFLGDGTLCVGLVNEFANQGVNIDIGVAHERIPDHKAGN